MYLKKKEREREREPTIKGLNYNVVHIMGVWLDAFFKFPM